MKVEYLQEKQRMPLSWKALQHQQQMLMKIGKPSGDIHLVRTKKKKKN